MTITNIDKSGDVICRFLYSPILYDSITNTGQETIKYFDLPKEYTVTDVNLLDDLVIFCGMKNSYEIDYDYCYIAYQAIDKLFDSHEINFHITPLLLDSLNGDRVRSIRRIESYYDTTRTIVVSAIGTMHYGKPDLHELHFDQGTIGDYWVSQPKNEYEYLMLYRITNSLESLRGYVYSINPPSAIGNRAYFYVNPLLVDTLYTDSLERFEDIAITDNYIALISSMSCIDYAQTGWYRYYIDTISGFANTWAIRRFDKNNFGNQVSKAFYQVDNIFSPDLEFKVTDISEDKIAIAHIYRDTTYFDQSIACVHKVDLSNNVAYVFNTQLYDYTMDTLKHIRDIKFDKGLNRLLVLKQTDTSFYAPEGDILVCVDLTDNITNYNQGLTYYVHGDTPGIPYNWNNIFLLGNSRFALIGQYDDNNLHYLDVSYKGELPNKCINGTTIGIDRNNNENYVFDTIDLANRAIFGCEVPTIVNVSDNISTIVAMHETKDYYFAIIQNDNIKNLPNDIPILEQCESEYKSIEK